MTVPPGWYPDPMLPGVRRWWDGCAWTGHTAAGPLPGFVPAGAPQVYIPPPTNHVLHLLLTLVTAGLWAPMWLLIGYSNSTSRNRAIRQAQGWEPRT